MNSSHTAWLAALGFAVDGTLESVAPYGSGHINDSYCAVFVKGERRERFLLQRINTHVFHDPETLMENIERVTTHLAAKVSGNPEESRRVLTLMRSHSGRVLPVQVGSGRRLLEDVPLYRGRVQLRRSRQRCTRV